MTEWPEFKSLEDDKDLRELSHKNIVDLRNLLSPEIMRSMGYSYTSIGRK